MDVISPETKELREVIKPLVKNLEALGGCLQLCVVVGEQLAVELFELGHELLCFRRLLSAIESGENLCAFVKVLLYDLVLTGEAHLFDLRL